MPGCKISDELVLEEPFQEGDIKLAPAFSCGVDLHMSREHEAVETDDSSSDSSMESGTGSYSHETSVSVSSTDDEAVHINDPYDAFPAFIAQVYNMFNLLR